MNSNCYQENRIEKNIFPLQVCKKKKKKKKSFFWRGLKIFFKKKKSLKNK